MSGYNGWTNKETWLVNVWLGDSLAAWQEEGEEVTAEYVQGFVEDVVSYAFDEERNGLVADFLQYAISEINFEEIAEHYQDEEVYGETV